MVPIPPTFGTPRMNRGVPLSRVYLIYGVDHQADGHAALKRGLAGAPGAEQWTKRVIDQGLTLRVDIEVTDPDTFYQPWKTYQLYRRTNGPLAEEICAENNTPLFDYGTPTDSTPDF